MTPEQSPAAVRVIVDGRARTFDGTDRVTIGRDPASDVPIDDRWVSRHHATLTRGRSGWVLEDAGSKRGIRVDGRVVRRVEITYEVRVWLGDDQGGIPVELTPVPSARSSPPRDGLHVGQRRSVLSVARDPIRVGRASDNDLVVDDLRASRHHAEIVPTSGRRWELHDLSSRNGTFLDGHRVARAPLDDGALIGIGRHTLRFTAGRLEEYVDTGGAALEAWSLTVHGSGGQPILDDVSLQLPGGSLLAVLGPTGSGKSTLMRALTGFRPADAGVVTYGGRDLYGAYDELRSRIGYVPQDDILHVQLRLRQALGYAAELRFAQDTSRQDRSARITEVLDELGLSARADLPIHNLSGGQRKRTNVATELLTKPTLLFLDEPTSGLDPGYERSVMQLLRDLADGGRTIVVVTHSVDSLDLCDRVLFLAPGGTLAYYGPTRDALGYFGRSRYDEVFQDLEGRGGAEWQQRFRRDPTHRRYLPDPTAASPSAAIPASSGRAPSRTGPGIVRQLSTVMRRQLAIIAADRYFLGWIVLQAPVIALLIAATTERDALTGALSPAEAGRGATVMVVLALVLAAAFMGSINGIREIVKELPIYRRERSTGLSLTAYIASKSIVFGTITVLQVVALVAIYSLMAGAPGEAVVVTSAPAGTELAISLALTGVAAVALALLVSAVVPSADRAVVLLPIILIVQFLLSGGAVDLSDRGPVELLSHLNSTRWGFAAAASSVDLAELLGLPCGTAAAAADASDLVRFCDAPFAATAGDWITSLGWLALLTLVALLWAAAALRRRDPLVGRRGT